MTERPQTYTQAATDLAIPAARERHERLTERAMCVRSAQLLRDRGTFDPDNTVHAEWAARQPLTADEHLQLVAAGEVLARHYSQPAMADRAARAGASWEQIGAARGISAEQARQDHEARAGGQYQLHTATGGRFGLAEEVHREEIQLAAELDGPEAG
ncbi:MAG: hypothetical protein ACRDPD_22225 [Streptosporangiaceae bacterium]